MRVLSILGFVLFATVKNRLRTQVKRLRQPKYLVATIAGLSYFWFVFGRRVFGNVTFGQVPDEVRPLFAIGGALLGLVFVLVGWMTGKSRPSLTFTEPEIHWLFAAPLTRRSVLLYKIGRNLALVALSALITTLLFGARAFGHGAWFFVGTFLALATLSLHEMVTSLGRGALRARGARGVVALAAGIGCAWLIVGVLAYLSVPRFVNRISSVGSMEDLFPLVRAFEKTPLGTALWPFRGALEAAMAVEPSAFLFGLSIAVGVLLLHIALVLRMDVAFEEASLQEAERRAKIVEARRSDRTSFATGVKGSFSLPAEGRPEWAIAWKGLIATRRMFAGRLAAFFLPLLALVGVLGISFGKAGGPGPAAGISLGLVVFASFIVLFGPTALRTDLRMDLPQMELLRALPLSGARLVAAELLGPLIVLTLALWAVIVGALVISIGVELPGLPVPLRIALALSVAILAPCLTLIGLIVQNAAVLLFPSWVTTGPEGARGIEATGQRLLTTVGSIFVLTAALIPAVFVGGAALGGLWYFVSPLLSPVAALITAAVVLVEAGFVVMLLGRTFDRYDLSLET